MISRTSADVFRGYDAANGDFDAQLRSRRANRRRLIVFGSTFVGLAFVGLVWVFSRPALYQSTARLDFVPVAGQGADDPNAGAKAYTLRDEVQYLTSRTLLARVWDDLKSRSDAPESLRSGDPPATLQSMLTATQVPGTNIVSITAQGGQPAFLPLFVGRLLADYQASLDERFKGGSTTALDDAGDEAKKLDTAVAAKRLEVDAFRAKNNIVSLERGENQVLSEVKGVGDSLNAANDKVVSAQARLDALKAAQASGKTVVRARDNPTLASLEQQASSIQADLRATARQFTQQYMDIDPRVREQRARLADIQEQMNAVRRDSQQGALQDAQEELASAKGAAVALRQQLASNQQSVQSFTSHFNEYRALQDQLAHLEQLRQKAADRLSTLDAGERGRKPKVEVVEPPAIPQSPSSPLYARDAALAVFAALVAALATMGVVEFFNRPPRQASTVVVPQTFVPVGMSMARDMPTMLAPSDARRALPSATERVDRPALPPMEPALPRELGDEELAALLRAADPEFRAIVALLLSGLTAGEIVALRQADVDRVTGIVRAGDDARTVRLPSNVVSWLPAASASVEEPLFAAPGGRPLAEGTVGTALLYAAHDAGLDGADAVTPDALRHTYIAYLVRQGVRFTELARIVGVLPAERLAAYRMLRPSLEAARPDGIDRAMPPVEAFDDGASRG